MKGKSYVFRYFYQRSKVCLVYLKCKLQQDSYGWCISNLKCQRTVESTYLKKSKLERGYRLYFQMLMSLHRKIRITFLGYVNKQAFQNLKKTAKNVNNGQKAKRMFLNVKMQQVRFCWCHYSLNCIKTSEIMYFQAKKQEPRSRVIYLEVSKSEKKYH